MAQHTDFDWTTTRERNLKKTKKDTRREFDLDVDAPPQETNKGYDMVGKQSPSDKCIISPTAGRTPMMPKWLDKTINLFAGKKLGEEKIVDATANMKIVDSYLDKHRIRLDEAMYCNLQKKVEASGDTKSIGKFVQEVYNEALTQAMSPVKQEKTTGAYDYKFSTVVGKAPKSQVRLGNAKPNTLADLISDVAAKMKTEITSDEIQDVTKQVQQEVGKRRHASNADISDIVHKAVEVIANKKIAAKLAHNGIRTTVDQINLESANKAAIVSTLSQKKEVVAKDLTLLQSAIAKVKQAAEKIHFPQSEISVQKQEKMPEGYEKEKMDTGKESSTPATPEAARAFQRIIDLFAEVAEIENATQQKIEEVKKESGLQKTVKKLEEAVVTLAAIAGTANNNAVQIKSKMEAVFNYAIMVTHERKQIQPTPEELEAEMKTKMPFFDLKQYEEMTKKLEETMKALKASKGYQLIEKKQPELKVVTKGSLVVEAKDEYGDLVKQINTLTKELEQFNKVMEDDIAEFETVEVPEEVEAPAEALPVAASAEPDLEKKANAETTITESVPEGYDANVEKEASWKSTKPPKKWWNEKASEVKKGNPDYSEEQVNATVGKIWSDMSEKDKAAKRHSEGKEYGKPKAMIGNDFRLRVAGYPDKYPYVDKCRNCAYFYSGLGTVYDKCVDCVHFYCEDELKELKKEDAAGLGDYFYDKSNRFNVGTPAFQQKHSSLKK